MPSATATKDTKDTSTNPLVKEVVEMMPANYYGEEQKEYLTHLQGRLESAYRVKSTIHPEFNNLTYYQRYENNLKVANTHHLDPKKNDDDVVVSSGTIESKLDSLLSHINNLNLSIEVLAYDKDKNNVVALGHALEDIIHDTECNEPGSDDSGDEEKRLARQREMLIQGEVFVQEEWLRVWEQKKVIKEQFDGRFASGNWDKKLTKVFEGPSRTMLYGPNVFLGDITEFYMEKQPYIFAVVQMSYALAKTRYGQFENWKYVRKGAIPQGSTGADEVKTIFENKWRLTELSKEQVEVVLYQDQPNDEFQILINGMLMLPIGYPLSAVSPMGKYNIVKQVFRVIHDKFAYGKGFVSSGSVQQISKIIDEMLRLFVLKERKSIMPAYVNTSGRVIDRKVLSPGRISMGIDPGSLQPIASNEVQGINAGEVGFYNTMNELIDKSTVSSQFAGQPGKSGTTATEVATLQQQASLTLTLSITSCALLEKKLGYLRLYNVLENWFDPIGTSVQTLGEARSLIKNYRRTTRSVSIDGAGIGERSVYATDQAVPDAESIRQLEIQDEKARGIAVRKIFLNPEELRKAKLMFYITVTPKEKESSNFYKTVFRDMLNDVIALAKLGAQLNIEGIEEEFARVWGKKQDKLFASAPPPTLGGMAGVPGQNGPQTPEQIAQGRGASADQPIMAPGALSAGGGGKV